MPSISSEAVNFHLDIEEPDPDLPYEPATGAEPVNTVQDEGIRDSQGWANHARRLGGLLLVTLTASLAPAVSAFAASDHEAPHRHTHHHKKHHRSHSKNITFDSTGSFDSTGVSPPNISEQPYPSQAPGLSVPALSLEELFQYAYADANATWGISTPPCNGNVTYQSEPNNFDTSQSWIMESTWHDLYTFPNGQTYDAVNTEGPEFNPRNFFGCTIDYNNQLQPNTSTSDMARNWTYFCTAVGHEWQHFLNEYSHETPIDHGQAVEPTNSISYPSWTGENTPAACITNAPPGVTKIILTSEDPSSKTWLVEPPPGGIDETVTTSPAGASLVFGS